MRRPLIRATLPRPEGQPVATRAMPEFTIRQPTNNRGGHRPAGRRRGGGVSHKARNRPDRCVLDAAVTAKAQARVRVKARARGSVSSREDARIGPMAAGRGRGVEVSSAEVQGSKCKVQDAKVSSSASHRLFDVSTLNFELVTLNL